MPKNHGKFVVVYDGPMTHVARVEDDPPLRGHLSLPMTFGNAQREALIYLRCLRDDYRSAITRMNQTTIKDVGRG